MTVVAPVALVTSAVASSLGGLELPPPSRATTRDAQPNLRHFWFVGCTAYVDQFQISRWTRFCMEPNFYERHAINKDVPLKFCALYNDTSDTEETTKRKPK